MTELEFKVKLIAFFESEKCDIDGYSTTRILELINNRKDSVELVENFFTNPKPSGGFMTLNKLGRLDLSLEAYVLERPEFHKLFSQEALEMAKFRLLYYGYSLKN